MWDARHQLVSASKERRIRNKSWWRNKNQISIGNKKDWRTTCFSRGRIEVAIGAIRTSGRLLALAEDVFLSKLASTRATGSWRRETLRRENHGGKTGSRGCRGLSLHRYDRTKVLEGLIFPGMPRFGNNTAKTTPFQGSGISGWNKK